MKRVSKCPEVKLVQTAIEDAIVVEKQSAAVKLVGLRLVFCVQRVIVGGKSWLLQLSGLLGIGILERTRVAGDKETWCDRGMLPVNDTGEGA